MYNCSVPLDGMVFVCARDYVLNEAEFILWCDHNAPVTGAKVYDA